MKSVKIIFEDEDTDRKAIINMVPTDGGGLATSLTFEPEVGNEETFANSTYAYIATDFLEFLGSKNK